MSIWPFQQRPTLTLGTFGPLPIGNSLVLGPKEMATHKHVIGVTGQGKSKFLASLFIQLLNQGVGCALIDPHADLADDILRFLIDTAFFRHPQALERLLYIDFSRVDRYLPFNGLAQPYDDHSVARHLTEVCKRAWPALGDGSAPQFENIFLAASLVLIQNRLPLTAMPRLLTDKAYRDVLLQHVTDPQIVDFFHSRFDAWGKDAPTMIESTLRRVFLLTFSPTLRYSLGQRPNSLNFRHLMDRGTAVIVNLGGLDEDTQRFLGCLITVGFEVAALSRTDLQERERRPYHLFMDEFSMFSAQSEEALSRVLSLARKYGLFLVMAHQTFSQTSTRLRGALQNAIEVAFCLGRNDAEWAAPHFGHFDPYVVKHEVTDPNQQERSHPVYFNMQETFESWAQELQGLKPREAYVSIGQKSAKIRTLSFPQAKCGPEALDDIKEQYAQRFMTPREVVVAEVDQTTVPPSEPTVVRRAKLGQ